MPSNIYSDLQVILCRSWREKSHLEDYITPSSVEQSNTYQVQCWAPHLGMLLIRVLLIWELAGVEMIYEDGGKIRLVLVMNCTTSELHVMMRNTWMSNEWLIASLKPWNSGRYSQIGSRAVKSFLQVCPPWETISAANFPNRNSPSIVNSDTSKSKHSIWAETYYCPVRYCDEWFEDFETLHLSSQYSYSSGVSIHLIIMCSSDTANCARSKCSVSPAVLVQ